MTDWHLRYTVRKLIRYRFKVREDDPNDLVSGCRNSFRTDFRCATSMLSPIKLDRGNLIFRSQ